MFKNKEISMKHIKNRLCYGLFINLILAVTNNVFGQQQEQHESHMHYIVPIAKNLRMQKLLSVCRVIVIPAIIAVTLYCNRQGVVESVVKYPLPFALTSYFLGNSIIDSISKYRQIRQALEFFEFSQTMNRYLLCMQAIKNSMKRLYISKNIVFDEQEFFVKVQKYAGHTFEELEIFVQQVLSSSVQSINRLCIDMNISENEEKICFVCKDQITVEQMLLVCKDDVLIYSKLLKFFKYPEQEYESLIQSICILMQQHFEYFVKKKLHEIS